MGELKLGVNLGISVYSAILLAFLIFAELRQTAERIDHPRRHRIFLITLIVTLVTIAADLLSRLDGETGVGVPICMAANVALFILSPALLLLWYLYVDEQVGHGEKLGKAGFFYQLTLCLANAAATAATPVTGWLFFFDAAGTYCRGPYFGITGFCMLAMILWTEVLLIRSRTRFSRDHFRALLLFPVISVAASVLQIVSYGIAFALNGTTLALLIVYSYAQNRSIDLDYLTGLYNRRKLDIRMQQEIGSSTPGRTFSAVMIDVDRFKAINDTMGHNVGDAALRDAADLLRSCLRADTFISRFGGDEFCLILDVQDEDVLRSVIGRIRKAGRDFTSRGDKPYALTFSIGGDVYLPGSGMDVEAFQKHIDALMYADKRGSAPETSPLLTGGEMPRRRAADRSEKSVRL